MSLAVWIVRRVPLARRPRMTDPQPLSAALAKHVGLRPPVSARFSQAAARPNEARRVVPRIESPVHDLRRTVLRFREQKSTI